MRQNTFYGSPDDNSDIGEIIRFIDRQEHLSATYKDLFANRLTLKASEEELKLASAPAVRTDGTYAYTDGGLGLGKLPNPPVLPFDAKNLGAGVSWPTLPVEQNGHDVRLAYYISDDGFWLKCTCGWQENLGFETTPVVALQRMAAHVCTPCERPTLPAKLSDLAGNESFIGGTLIEHVEHSEYTAEHGRAKILSIGWNKARGEDWFEIATDSDRAWNGVNVKLAGNPDLIVMPDGAIRYQCPFGACYTILPKGYSGAFKPTGGPINWPTLQESSELPPEFKSDMVAQLNQPLEQFHDSLESCTRFLADKYKLDAAVIEKCIADLAAGFVVGRSFKKIGLRPDDLMTTLARHLLGEREQIQLMDELRASLNRESIKAQLQSLKDQGIQEGLKLAKQLAKASFGPQLKESLLDICREFDAIDLSECNRRLEAGEPFDAACDEAMEKRQSLGEQIKERLGAEWGDFERRHEDFLKEFPDQESRSACAVVAHMIDAAAYSLHSSVVEPINLTDDAWALMRRYAQRIGVLLS